VSEDRGHTKHTCQCSLITWPSPGIFFFAYGSEDHASSHWLTNLYCQRCPIFSIRRRRGGLRRDCFIPDWDVIPLSPSPFQRHNVLTNSPNRNQVVTPMEQLLSLLVCYVHIPSLQFNSARPNSWDVGTANEGRDGKEFTLTL
jgi:hypothetical protein